GVEQVSLLLQPLALVDRVPGIVDHVPRPFLAQLGVDLGPERCCAEVAGTDRGDLDRACCLVPAISGAAVEFPDLVALAREMRQRAQYRVAEPALDVGLDDETAQRSLLARCSAPQQRIAPQVLDMKSAGERRLQRAELAVAMERFVED